MIIIIEDKESLKAYESDWNSLYDRINDVTPFQKYGYIFATIDFVEKCDYSLYFILLRDAQRKEIVAIFPFVKNKSQELEFFNQRHTDFCIPLIHPEVDHFNLFKELAERIWNDNSVKGFDIINLLPNESLISSLKYHFKFSLVHDINYFPLVPINAASTNKSFIDGFVTIPSKRRGNLKKSYTQIEDRCSLTVMCKFSGFDYPEDVILDITGDMVSKGIRGRDYFSETMLSWWRRLYEADILSLAILYENKNPVACTLIFQDDVRNECITWIMLYKDSVWNMKSNLFISKYIYEHGNGTLNLARGIYDYKVTNFHPDVKPLFCVKIAKTKWGHFKNIISTSFHYFKPIVKSWLGK